MPASWKVLTTSFRLLTCSCIAWAAAAVLLIAPESLVGASFQMSFAAVVALIAIFEATGERLAAMRADSGVLRRALLHLGSLSLASVVAHRASYSPGFAILMAGGACRRQEPYWKCFKSSSKASQ